MTPRILTHMWCCQSSSSRLTRPIRLDLPSSTPATVSPRRSSRSTSSDSACFACAEVLPTMACLSGKGWLECSLDASKALVLLLGTCCVWLQANGCVRNGRCSSVQLKPQGVMAFTGSISTAHHIMAAILCICVASGTCRRASTLLGHTWAGQTMKP